MSKLSSRFRARPTTPGDAQGILAVGIARDIEDLGHPDYSLDDVREELAEAERAWVVEGEAGEVVAAAMLAGGDARVLVHPDACGQGVGTHLRELVEAAAPPGAVLRQDVGGSNDAARTLLEAAGYRTEQHFWRMVLELDVAPPPVAWPEGVSVREYAPADAPAAHALVQDTFAGIPGNVARGLEEWRRPFAPELSTVAFATGRSLAGAVLCERWQDGGQGFVSYIATALDWRGRGLGRALLVDALTRMRATGLNRAGLGVNGRNRSATALYESVGMRVEWGADRYEKRLP